MRGALCSASGLSRLRPLQGSPGSFCQSDSLSSFPWRGVDGPFALWPFMRIAVDVMGGDHGCGVVIDGVKLALAAYPKISEMFLVGKTDEIKTALARSRCHDPRVKIV